MGSPIGQATQEVRPFGHVEVIVGIDGTIVWIFSGNCHQNGNEMGFPGILNAFFGDFPGSTLGNMFLPLTNAIGFQVVIEGMKEFDFLAGWLGE